MSTSLRAPGLVLALGLAVVLAGCTPSTAHAAPPVEPVAAKSVEGVRNGPIAFGRVDPELGDFSLWTARADGSHQRRLTRTPSYFSDWAPDGSAIVFDHVDGSDEHIATITRDGRRTELTSGAGIQEVPRYSPDGRRIAFDASTLLPDDPAFATHISVMDADGSHVRQLTHDGFDVEPAWSPDGRRLVFGRIVPSSDSIQSEGVYVVGVDGTGLRRVVAPRPGLEHPRWSPDGRSITFNIAPESTAAPGSGSIFSVRADGTHLHVLRAASAAWRFTKGVWSPDGRSMLAVCVDVAARTDDLCRFRPGNGAVHVVVRGTREQPVNYPSWGPRR